jgi:hypothetical protein
MKKSALFFLILLNHGFISAQLPKNDYGVSLQPNEKFIKISRNQIIDSVNKNQSGPEQFEYFEISLSESEKLHVETFMSNCREIQSILNKFGNIEIDVTMASNSDLIRPLSGFYYAVGYNQTTDGQKLTLYVIYPRKDKMT